MSNERTYQVVVDRRGFFVVAYYVPWSHPVIRQFGLEAFMMLQEYAREHVLTCLIPAFFIAGAIAVFISQASVLKYFGAQASKIPKKEDVPAWINGSRVDQDSRWRYGRETG